MKAIILAAGYATRLYPLTLNTPKPLLDINGKPIIEYILNKILETDVDEIFIVTNNKFFNHFNEWLNNYKTNIPIKVLNDGTLTNETRLGAIGDINFAIKKENIKDDILVVGGDNLFKLSLKELINFQKSKNTSVIAAHDIKNKELAKLYGILSINGNNKIIEFNEKPQLPNSTIASTCIYFLSKETLNLLNKYIEEGNPSDKTGHFIQWLYKKEDIHAFIFDSEWFDIGSKQGLDEAKQKIR